MTPTELKLLAKLQTNEGFRNEVVAHVFKAANPDYILRWNKAGGLFLRNKPIPETQLRNLQSEVKFLKKSSIWPVLTETLVADAYERMFMKSQNFEDMRSGKMELLAVATMEGIINRIELLKLDPPLAAKK
jgi:hypothetical protein